MMVMVLLSPDCAIYVQLTCVIGSVLLAFCLQPTKDNYLRMAFGLAVCVMALVLLLWMVIPPNAPYPLFAAVIVILTVCVWSHVVFVCLSTHVLFDFKRKLYSRNEHVFAQQFGNHKSPRIT